MNTTVKGILLAAVIASFASVSQTHAAEGRAQLRLYPGPGIPEAPRLGIYGHFEWGRGMVVDSVAWGTPAARMGLEPGDLIRAINGRPVESEWDYFQALSYSGGYARVTVRDVRSGMLITRTAFVGGDDYGSGSVAGLQVGPRIRVTLP
jgi:S1-C subfamily serine protease